MELSAGRRLTVLVATRDSGRSGDLPKGTQPASVTAEAESTFPFKLNFKIWILSYTCKHGFCTLLKYGVSLCFSKIFIHVALGFHHCLFNHVFIQSTNTGVATVCWACSLLWVTQHL